MFFFIICTQKLQIKKNCAKVRTDKNLNVPRTRKRCTNKYIKQKMCREAQRKNKCNKDSRLHFWTKKDWNLTSVEKHELLRVQCAAFRNVRKCKWFGFHHQNESFVEHILANSQHVSTVAQNGQTNQIWLFTFSVKTVKNPSGIKLLSTSAPLCGNLNSWLAARCSQR